MNHVRVLRLISAAVNARVIAACFAALVLSGCGGVTSLFSNRLAIYLQLPSIPSQWRSLAPFRYRLSFPASLSSYNDAGGGSADAVIGPAAGRSGANVRSATPGRSAKDDRTATRPGAVDEATLEGAWPLRGTVIAVEIPKLENLPLLVTPIPAHTARTDLLRPAGAVYPMDLARGRRIEAHWNEGFLATLLLPLAQQGTLLESVNAARLQKQVLSVAEGDPWAIDPEAILVGMAYGSMRSSRVELRPRHDIALTLRPGKWIWGDPLRPTQNTDDELREVPTGFHVLVHAGAGSIADRVSLLVGKDGWESLDAVTGDESTGRW